MKKLFLGSKNLNQHSSSFWDFFLHKIEFWVFSEEVQTDRIISSDLIPYPITLLKLLG